MSTRAEVVSTFDSSSAPDWMVPNPEPPATPCTTEPEAVVCDQLALPICCRPWVLAKFAMATWPRSTERPLVKVAWTTPVLSMLMPVRVPVVKPFCCTAVTEKVSPVCCVLARLRVMFMSAAPVAGV